MRYLSSLFLFFLLVSCRSLDPTMLNNAAQHYTTLHHAALDSLATRDSVYTRDSIFESVRQKADTVYRDHVVYRDRVQFRDRWRERIVHDTIIHTDSIVEVIEHPPREVIPPFYKRCTALFWTLMALLLLYVLIRFR